MEINTIELNTSSSAIFLLGGLILIWFGRPEVAIGIYYSLAGWRRTVTIFDVPHTYVLLVIMLFATLVIILRNGKIILPLRHRRIVIGVILWWIWTLLVVTVFNSVQKMNVYRDLTTLVIAPLPFLILVPKELSRTKWFAVSYVVTTVVGGLVALSLLNIPVNGILLDPTLKSFGIHIGLVSNYHAFGQMFLISVLFLYAIILESKSMLVQILSLLLIAYCLYFLSISGSRQSIGGAIVPLFLFVIWSLKLKTGARLKVFAFVAIASLAFYYLLTVLPDLIIRGMTHQYALNVKMEKSILDAFDLINNRGGLWQDGFKVFLSSPVWGTGYENNTTSHNFFIGIMANEGIVGFGFMIIFLIFLIRLIKDFWTGTGCGILDIWKTALTCIILYAFITGLASGTQISLWHIWWGAGLLWGVNENILGKDSGNYRQASFLVHRQLGLAQQSRHEAGQRVT